MLKSPNTAGYGSTFGHPCQSSNQWQSRMCSFPPKRHKMPSHKLGQVHLAHNMNLFDKKNKPPSTVTHCKEKTTNEDSKFKANPLGWWDFLIPPPSSLTFISIMQVNIDRFPSPTTFKLLSTHVRKTGQDRTVSSTKGQTSIENWKTTGPVAGGFNPLKKYLVN